MQVVSPCFFDYFPPAGWESEELDSPRWGEKSPAGEKVSGAKSAPAGRAMGPSTGDARGKPTAVGDSDSGVLGCTAFSPLSEPELEESASISLTC